MLAQKPVEPVRLLAGAHPPAIRLGCLPGLLPGYLPGMRLGVLDIGSNSAQLQIVDVTAGGPPLPAQAVKEPTLLGEEMLPDGSIGEAGIDRVCAGVCLALRVAEQQSVDNLYTFVTSAIRDATNRDQVLDRVEATAGVRPQYLSGDEEARLTYLAAHRWYGWSAGRLLLLDIGGGSMEIVLGRDAEPQLAISLRLGAGRMTREFLPTDPPSQAQLKTMRRHVRETLGEVADRVRWEGDPRRVVATSKTFKQLARLAGAPPQRKGPFVRRVLTRQDAHAWIRRLARLTAEQRSHLRGVSGSRARQILAGAILADLTMTTLDIDSVEVCPWALREGIVLRHLESMAYTPPFSLRPLHRPADEPTATVTQLIPAPTDMPVDIRHAQPLEQVHHDGDPRQLPAASTPPS
jgi:exopolyphosphatase/guanosine-5'-triphosphate,3'-diphosphate pyrophosphatase